MTYESTAEYYDLIHSSKNYAADVQRIVSIVDAELPGAVTLLDAGCEKERSSISYDTRCRGTR